MEPSECLRGRGGRERRRPLALGRELVDHLVALGVILDLAHASHGLFAELLHRAAGAPILCSHGGCRGVHETPRNLDDDQLRALVAVGGQHLLLDAADRQHLPAQRDLAGHGDIAAHLAVRSRQISAVAIVMPADGPSFGTAPAGTWTWMSLVLKKFGSIPS